MSKKDLKTIAQPPLKPGRPAGQPNFMGGSKRSTATLKHLGFDPIGKLVERYAEMEAEVFFWKGIRDRSIIQVLDASGKERRYDSDAHMAAEKMLMDIGDKLLRYGYGRVPETVNVNDNRAPPLIVNLTAKGEEQHFINAKVLEQKDEDDYEGENP